MRVAKWGNSLAVRLPKTVVDELGLKEGDEVELGVGGPGRLTVARKDRAAEILERLRGFEWQLPRDYRFDREEANQRGFREDDDGQKDG